MTTSRLARTSAVLSCTVLTTVIASTALADNTDAQDDAFKLGEVIVTARARDNSMIGGAVVEQDNLRRFAKTTVDQALDLVPGTAGGNSGGSRNERLIYIRGFDRFQSTLSIDGVRVFLPADNRIDFARFLTADLSEIQISKGYVSVLDGPGALGGAINLVTRKPVAPLEAEVVANGSFDGNSTYNGYTVSGRVGMRQNNFYVQASGATAQQDHWALSKDFVPTVLEDGGDRDHSDSRDYRFNLKAGFTPNATDEYALNFTKQSGEKNAPYHVTDTASTRYWAWPYWNLDSLSFLSNTELGDKTYLRTRVYTNSFDNALFSYDDAAQTIQSLPRAFRSYYADKAYGARVELGSELVAGNTVRGSLHYRRDKHVEWQEGFIRVPATGSPFSNVPYLEPHQTTEEDTYSVAVEDTQLLGAQLDLVTGLSYDWTDLRSAQDFSVFVTGSGASSVLNQQLVNYPLHNSHALNGQAALNYRWSDTLRTHFSVSSRARFPTLFERFSSRFGTAVPNPDIGPERATNYELGGDITVGGVHLESAVFYSNISDALLSIPVVFGAPISATLNQTRNVGDGHYSGIEFSADASVSTTVKVGGNYAYMARTLIDPTNAAFHPTGVPTNKLFAYADWRVTQNLVLTPSVEWDSSRWTVTSSSTITPPQYYRTGAFTMINLALSWNINRHFDALIGGRNLFDRNYQLVDGFPEEGRHFYASVRGRY